MVTCGDSCAFGSASVWEFPFPLSALTGRFMSGRPEQLITINSQRKSSAHLSAHDVWRKRSIGYGLQFQISGGSNNCWQNSTWWKVSKMWINLQPLEMWEFDLQIGDSLLFANTNRHCCRLCVNWLLVCSNCFIVYSCGFVYIWQHKALF